MPKHSSKSPRHAPSLQVYDAEDLTQYLSASSGFSAAGVSSFGAQLEQFAIKNWAEIRCPVCRRRAYRRKKLRNGHGPSERVVGLFLRAGWTVEQAVAVLDEIADSKCRRCGGNGTIIVPITKTMRESPEIERNETGSSRHGKPPVLAAASSDEDEMHRMGRIGNRLIAMTARDPEATDALRRWQGQGGRCLLRLYPLTEAGRALLRHKKSYQQHWLSFLESEQERRKEGYPDHVRDRLYEKAETEAELLLETAVMLWNELAQDEGEDTKARKKRAMRAEARLELGRTEK